MTDRTTTSRRDFLSQAALTASLLAVSPWQLLMRPPTAGEGLGSRPGLLFDESDVARIRETAKHPRFAAYWNTLSNANLEVDKRFLREELRLNNHVSDFLKARTILERTSFVYAISGNPSQLEVAKLAIDRILEYRKWDYFLEGGEHTIGLQRAPEATIAMAFAREWLDGVLSDATKREIEIQIAEKGAPACYRTLYGMKYPDRVRGWGFDPESDYKFRFDLSRWPFILNSTNLKVIPIAGLGIAACLLHDKHPQAQRWLELALQSARAFAPMFGSDGSYDEGVSYWGYTALHLTLFVEVLYRILGIDERSLINYPGTVRYGLQMSMPTTGKRDDCVNFGDASTLGDVSVAAWAARRHRDSTAQYVATSIGEVRTHYGLVWFDRSIPSAMPGRELHDVRFKNDWVVSRTGWDEEGSVVALRSGGPANHEHADRNSVIFKAYGERLLHDPFKAAYSYTLPHWVLRQTEAHTAVLIDGKGHQYHDGREGTNASWAEARILQYQVSDHGLVVTSDATEAYALVNPEVDLIRRTVIFLKPDVLLLFDRVRLKSMKAPVQVRFQVYNEDGQGRAEVGGADFHVLRPRASLRGSLFSPNSLTVRTGFHDVPKDIGVYPYVDVGMSEALDHQVLTVCTAQRTAKEHGVVASAVGDQLWIVQIDHNRQRRRVTVRANDDLPTVGIS